MLLNSTLVTYRYVDFKSPNSHVGCGIPHTGKLSRLGNTALGTHQNIFSPLYLKCWIIDGILIALQLALSNKPEVPSAWVAQSNSLHLAIQVKGFCLVSFEITALSLLSQTSVGGKAALSVYAILVHFLTSHEKLELLGRKLGISAVLYSSFCALIISSSMLPVGVVITFKDHH